MNLLLLLAGLGLILAGANALTDGSVALARRLRVPAFIVGLTVVAVGTSAPELTVSLLAAVGGKGDMAVGNVVGSNLFNGLVILGLCALVRPLPLTRGNVRRDIPFGVAASALLLLFVAGWSAGRITRIEGIVMLLLYVLLIGYTIRTTPRPAADEAPQAGMPVWRMTLFIAGGLAALVGGGELFLRSATALARTFGVSESTIALTLVAGGTSLPELASSLAAVVKRQPDIALGNVVGSNIANILLVLGASAAISPLTPDGITRFDLLMVFVASMLLLMAAFTFRRRSLDRWEGALFLLLYAGYLFCLLK